MTQLNDTHRDLDKLQHRARKIPKSKRTVAILVDIILRYRLSPGRTAFEFDMVNVDACGFFSRQAGPSQT